MAKREYPRFFMEPGVIQNHKNLPRIISHHQCSQKDPERSTIANFCKTIDKIAIRYPHRPKNMLRFLLPQTHNLRLKTYPGPSLKQSWLQTKCRFIFKKQNPPFFLKFFLMSDMYAESTAAATGYQPEIKSWSAVAQKILTHGESS